ncbi:triphosphoribosyl-dephospho-CoA synthase [Methylicorpusculum sp.]|uniref:triphosphoribosyl-dephospho-CoA synthase n=2 Tax=Methylicorpusculum sp. TaxID=2713644 RepID=UPI00272178D8|nr:triphosphoribosyl-dephospho-CoA synthase [Methylicorpusculum sp.]MDO8846321.1 triphosphoribosyl-dephospho-CoA synthase [Methylicorpusculum sp.]
MISHSQLAELYISACEIELQAFKPGNVSVYAPGHDMTVDDFRLSAAASATAICNPGYSLGEKIYFAVQATQEAVGCNTNLGIILLCAPLFEAVQQAIAGQSIRVSLHNVLNQTTCEDAEWVFKAIALASPGGLGQASEQDVHSAPSVTLADAMKLACERDRIALQYVTDFKDIYELSILSYNDGLTRWGSHYWAAVSVYTALLARYPDSHIERKYGDRFTGWVAEKMAAINSQLQGATDPEDILPLLYQVDKELKAHHINPGTTADLTVATVMAVFLEDLVK